MNKQMQSINQYIIKFFSENDVDEWQGDENQKKFTQMLKKLTTTPKKKDLNAPKKSRSAYLFFCQDNRPRVTDELKEELGDEFEYKLVLGRIGELWRELKESDNAKDKKKVISYTKQAVEDKKRYQDQMVNYTPLSSGSESDSESKPTKKAVKKPKKAVKKPKAVKKAKNIAPGFTRFCEESRDDAEEELGDDATETAISKVLSRMWKDLDDEAKQGWKDAACQEVE